MIPHNINSTCPAGAKVQERILKVAEKLFAEKGFEDTSIRDITAQAKCNLAAVNYHFGGKENLYIKVFQRHLDVMRDRRIQRIQEVFSHSQGQFTIEMLLDAFCRAFVEPFISDPQGQIRIRLMIREMQEQHLPDDMFVKEVITPVKDAFVGAMLKIYPTLEEKITELCMQTVVQLLLGQFMHLIHRDKMPHKIQEIIMPEFDLEAAREHIVRFCAAGIKAYAEGISQ